MPKKSRRLIAFHRALEYYGSNYVSEFFEKTLVEKYPAHILYAKSPSFSLANFEGPLELLLYLIQQDEMDVCDVTLKEVTRQFTSSLDDLETVDVGADFLSLATTLLLMKSRKLLPKEEVGEESEEPARYEMLHKLLEYCRFRDVAQELSTREEEQRAFFPRETSSVTKERGPGLEEVGLAELSSLLQEVMKRAAARPTTQIHEEEWQVGPKIEWIKEQLQMKTALPFTEVFTPEKSRGELTVLFLALLEMMKLQELKVFKNEDHTLTIRRA